MHECECWICKKRRWEEKTLLACSKCNKKDYTMWITTNGRLCFYCFYGIINDEEEDCLLRREKTNEEE